MNIFPVYIIWEVKFSLINMSDMSEYFMVTLVKTIIHTMAPRSDNHNTKHEGSEKICVYNILQHAG